MTVAVQSNRVEYTASSGQTSFPYPFSIDAASEVLVIHNNLLRTLGVHYNLTGIGNPAGGTVVLTTPAALNDTLVLLRVLPYTQLSDYVPNQPFPANIHETDHDRLIKIAQQLKEITDRCLQLDVVKSHGMSGLELPWPGEFAALVGGRKVLAWNTAETNLDLIEVSTETGIVGDVVPNAAFSSFPTPTSTGKLRLRTDAPKGLWAADGTRWQKVGGPWVYASECGAVPNTESTAAIQAAINACAAMGGGTVILDGMYVVSSTLTISTDGVSLCGYGAMCGLLVNSDLGEVLVISKPNPADRIIGTWLRDLRIYCSVYQSSGIGVDVVNCVFGGMENVVISNCYQSVRLSGCLHYWLDKFSLDTGSLFPSLQTDAYLLRIREGQHPTVPGTSVVFVTDFDMHGDVNNDFVGHGIIIESCDGLWFNNGHVGWTSQAVLYIEKTNPAVNLYGTQWVNVWFDQAPGAGQQVVRITGALATALHTFTQCVFEQPLGVQGKHGVVLDQVGLQNVRFDNCEFINISGHVIHAAGGVDSLQVSDCSIHVGGDGTTPYSGILLSPGDDFIRIQSNAFFSSSGAVNQTGIFVIPSASMPSGTIQINNNTFLNFPQGSEVLLPFGFAEVGMLSVSDNLGSATNMLLASNSSLTIPMVLTLVIITGTTTIGTINQPFRERRITLLFNATLTVAHLAGNIALRAGVNLVTTPGTTLNLIGDGSFWREV